MFVLEKVGVKSSREYLGWMGPFKKKEVFSRLLSPKRWISIS